jgi:hypothetical protein
VYLLMQLHYQFPEEKVENSNSPLKNPVRHMKSHNFNVTSPTKTQRVTHTFGEGQQDCLTMKMEATQPFETSRTASYPD